MRRVVGIIVPADERTPWVEPGLECDHRALEWARARVWRIERGKGATAGAEEAVLHVVIVYRVASDFSLRVDVHGDASLVRAGAGAGRVKSNDLPIRATHDGVIDIVRILVLPCDRSFDIDAIRKRALGGPWNCARTRRVDGRYVAVGIPNKSVVYRIGIDEPSNGGTKVIYVNGERTPSGPRAGTRSIKRDDGRRA